VKATVEWAKASDNARGYLQMVALPVQILYDLLRNGPAYFQGFSAAAEASFGALGRAWKKVKEGDFSGAKQEFTNLGQTAGEAYRLAFAAASAKKAEAAATQARTAADPQEQRTQGGDGITDADRQKAAEKAQKDREAEYKKKKAAQDKADQQELDDLKSFTQEITKHLKTRSDLARLQAENADTDELKRRELQRQKINEDADKQYEALTGKEVDYTDRVQAILEERDLKLRELQKGFEEQDEEERQKKLEEKLTNMEADEEVEQATLAEKRANGLISEQEYQDQLYELVRQGLEKRLNLLVAAGQGESVEAKKIQAALSKGQADHITKGKKQEEDLQKFEQKMAASKVELLKEGLQLVEDNLDKKSAAYQLFKAARKTAELAEIGINLAAELQNNSKVASENPLNGITAGAAGATQLVVSNGLSIARAAGAAIKLAAFAKGGRTDKGELLPLASLVNGASGGSFASGGPVDKATIGLIGEAGPELVIPNWMYADPKQANLMGFLEAQIASRGGAFANGGSTTGASPVASTISDDSSGQLVELMQLFVRGQQEFRDEIGDWQRNLVVQNNLQEVAKGLKTVQEVKQGGGIR
jgi:hypothetical protein